MAAAESLRLHSAGRREQKCANQRSARSQSPRVRQYRRARVSKDESRLRHHSRSRRSRSHRRERKRRNSPGRGLGVLQDSAVWNTASIVHKILGVTKELGKTLHSVSAKLDDKDAEYKQAKKRALEWQNAYEAKADALEDAQAEKEKLAAAVKDERRLLRKREDERELERAKRARLLEQQQRLQAMMEMQKVAAGHTSRLESKKELQPDERSGPVDPSHALPVSSVNWKLDLPTRENLLAPSSITARGQTPDMDECPGEPTRQTATEKLGAPGLPAPVTEKCLPAAASEMLLHSTPEEQATCAPGRLSTPLGDKPLDLAEEDLLTQGQLRASAMPAPSAEQPSAQTSQEPSASTVEDSGPTAVAVEEPGPTTQTEEEQPPPAVVDAPPASAPLATASSTAEFFAKAHQESVASLTRKVSRVPPSLVSSTSSCDSSSSDSESEA